MLSAIMKTTTSRFLRFRPLVLLLAGLLLIPAGATFADNPVLKPVLVCDEPVYDFGSAVSTGTIEHSYPIRNDGQLTLNISSVRASCGCTVAKLRDEAVPPGGTSAIDVSFNLNGRQGFQTKTITITSDDPDRPSYQLTLKGTVVKPVWATPAALYLGRIASPDARHATFSVESEIPITVSNWHATGAIPPSIEYLGAAPGSDSRRHDFRISIQPPPAEGPFNGDIRVETDDSRQPLIVIPYTGFWAIPVAD